FGEGLAYDRCQVGVVTNLLDFADLADDFDVRDADYLWKGLRTQVDVVLPDGAAVLNAADARVCEMAPLCDGEVIFYATDPDLPTITQHREAGGRCVYARNGHLTLARGDDEEALIELAACAATPPGCPPHAVEALLAAVAAAWAL